MENYLKMNVKESVFSKVAVYSPAVFLTLGHTPRMFAMDSAKFSVVSGSNVIQKSANIALFPFRIMAQYY